MIIVTSSGWDNYRHQANAYAMYQLLKKNGVDDDHIILISDDDIAYNPKNPKPGFIQSPFSDENLYTDVHVDYRLSELKFSDLKRVFSDTPNFPDDENHDTLLYWVGDGEPSGPKWGSEIIPPHEIADALLDIVYDHHYRRMLLAMETDYGGQVGLACEKIEVPAVFCMCATNENEISKASRTDASGQIWISNSFTENLLQLVPAQEDKFSLYQFYQETYNKTIGSHVTLYNLSSFGKLKRVDTKDFFYP